MRRIRTLALAACVAALGCASARRHAAPAADPAAAERERIARDFGVEVLWVRSLAANHMLEFRFRVLDPERAAPLLARRNKAQLVDPRSGRALAVPAPPKIGPLRTTTSAPEAGRTYFALFGNPGGAVPVGSRVTVAIGEFRAADLVVE